MSKQERAYALDWLRVLATLAVFLFHSGAAFAAGDWHLNAPTKSFAITVWNGWLLLWIMPLLFLIAGASTLFSLQKRAPRRLLHERVNRLLVPLLFGILIVVPPQVYIERLSRGQFSGSFWAFYPHYFDGWYLAIGGPGNFAWMGLHLWFLLLLLVLTLTQLPLIQWWQQQHPGFSCAAHYLQQPAWILLLALPVAVIEWLWGNLGVGGWNMLTYPLFFLYGALLFALPAIGASLRSALKPALVTALLSTTLLFVTLYGDGVVAFDNYATGWQRLLHAISGWSWVVVLLGWGYRSWNWSNELLRFANEAVLPFYILHQTVIVLLGYWVQQLPIPLLLQYSVLILLSFVAILATYLGAIHPLPWLRYSFGMKTAHQDNNTWWSHR